MGIIIVNTLSGVHILMYFRLSQCNATDENTIINNLLYFRPYQETRLVNMIATFLWLLKLWTVYPTFCAR